MSSIDQKDPANVARGLKAAIHNPNVSDEAKANASERLHEMGTDTGDVSSNRQRGGYKATLTNPNTSEEAKAHAREVLDQGFKGEQTGTQFESGKNESNVLRGYKGTLNNPRVSDKAKQHAEEVLRDHDAL